MRRVAEATQSMNQNLRSDWLHQTLSYNFFSLFSYKGFYPEFTDTLKKAIIMAKECL